MTVAAKPSIKIYNEDGSTSSFSAPFRYNDPTDLVVDRIANDGTLTNLPYGTGFTATDGTTDAGGTVTVITLSTGTKLRIRRSTARSQGTDYQTSGRFPAKTTENDFDLAMLINQEQDDAQSDLQERALLVPIGETPAVLPPAATRAGQVLGFDASGNPIASSGGGADAALRTDIAQPNGAALSGFSQDGDGAVPQTALFAIRRIAAYAEQFGAVGEEGVDDTVAISNFLRHCKAYPGIPHQLGQKTYRVSGVLPTLNVGSCLLEGVGTNIHDGGGQQVSGSVLRWIGGAYAGPMLTISAVPGSNNPHLPNCRFTGIGIDCANGLLGGGLAIYSLWFSDVDIAVVNASDTGILMGCVDPLSEAADTQKNRFRIQCRQIEAPNGYGMRLTGTASANVSANKFHFTAQHANAHAVSFQNSDNNDWEMFTTFCAGSASYAGVLYGSNGGAESGARGEKFWFLSGNKPLYMQGTDDASLPTKRHRIFFRDVENGTPAPVLGTGAMVDDQNWYAFTPAITGIGGSGAAFKISSCSYRLWMGMLEYRLNFICTAPGVGNSHIGVTMPFIAMGSLGGDSGQGKERAINGKSLNGYIDGSSNLLTIDNFDGSSPLVANGAYTFKGAYRVAA